MKSLTQKLSLKRICFFNFSPDNSSNLKIILSKYFALISSLSFMLVAIGIKKKPFSQPGGAVF